MTEFCNKIKIIPVSDVHFVYRNNIRPKPSKSFDTIITDSFSIEPKGEYADAGYVWSVNQTIVTDKVSDLLALKYQIPRSVIIQLEKTNGEPVVLGSIDYPVQLILVLGLQSDQLIISLETTDRPIL